MLKFKQTAAAGTTTTSTTAAAAAASSKLKPPRNPQPSSSSSSAAAPINPAFSNVKCEPCKASIIIHNITIPLAWPASEYFDHKGEWREFNVCLSLKAAGGKLMRSKIHQRVNRTITDLQFDESFVFSDLEPDFTIEALVSAKRINNAKLGSSSPFQSVANTVSRSFGRRFGANYKKYSQAQNSYTISAYNFPSREEIFSSPVEDLLPVGRCFFRLENAGLSGKIRVYSLALVSAETINPLLPQSDLLPLFGTMCSQVLCVPDCLQITFIRSILDIFYVDEQLLLEKLECALEGGCIKCFTKDKKEAALVIPIDQRTKIRTTAYQTAIRITLLDDETQYTRDFIFILSNENQVTDWSFALRQQISNASAWKEFASISTNPFALKYGSSEFKRPFDDSQSIKGRTMTNTDEIRGGFKSGGLREVSRRGDRPRVQSVFKDIPSSSSSKNEESKKIKHGETKDYGRLKHPTESKTYSKTNENRNVEMKNLNIIPKPRSTSTPKSPDYSSSNKTATSKPTSEVQRPKIVETKPTPKPRLIDSSSAALPSTKPISKPRLIDPTPPALPPSSSTKITITKPHSIDPPPPTTTTASKSQPAKQIVLVNRGYVSSPTKTSPRIPRKDPPTQTVTTSVKYVDSVKSVAEEQPHEQKPRQKVKLEFKEDTVEHSLLPPRPHRISRPPPESSGSHKTPIPVIIEEEHHGQKYSNNYNNNNNNNSVKAPPNTYVIRLNVGMDDDEDEDKNHRDPRKPPPTYASSRYQSPPATTKPFTRSSQPKPYEPHPPSAPSSLPPPQSTTTTTFRQKMAPASSSSISANSYSSKPLPKYFNTNFDTEITRL